MKDIKLKDRPVFKNLSGKAEALLQKGKPILSTFLKTVGDLTGKDSLVTLGKIVSGSKELTGEEIDQINHELDIDLKHFEIEESNKTERWKADMNSDSWLSKNIRPMTVAVVVLLLVYVIIAGVHGKKMSDAYVGMFSVIVTTVIGGYFTLRSLKDKSNKDQS